MKFKLGDIVQYKPDGTLGVIVPDPDNQALLVVRIHPHIFAAIQEDQWDLYKSP